MDDALAESIAAFDAGLDGLDRMSLSQACMYAAAFEIRLGIAEFLVDQHRLERETVPGQAAAISWTIWLRHQRGLFAEAVREHAPVAECRSILAPPTPTPTHTPAPPTATPTLGPPTSTPLPPCPTATPTPPPTATPTATATPRPTPTPRPTATPMFVLPYTTRFDGFQNARWLAQENPNLARRMESISWVSDGLDATESAIIENLLYLAAQDNQEVVAQLIAMPFLHSPDPADQSAVNALQSIGRDTPYHLGTIMTHNTVASGITDAWTSVVATLKSAAENNPTLIGDLLDRGTVRLEQRTTNLPLGGEVQLAIVRVGPRATSSMDLLEHAVHAAETFLGVPFPAKHVVLLFADAVDGSSAGTYYGSHIVVLPEYDVDDRSHEADSAPVLIAHEVAHYYWSGNADWVDEGLADLSASVAEYIRIGDSIRTTNEPCALHTIAELGQLNPARDNPTHKCNYFLGERLFLELMQGLGEIPFRERLRTMYVESVIDGDIRTSDTGVGIAHVRRIFGDTPEGETIIKRWYDGTVPYDTSRIDTSPAIPSLPGINGRIDSAYVSLSSGGAPIASFSSGQHNGWAYINLDYSYRVAGGPYQIEFQLVEMYEDGHEIGRMDFAIEAQDRYSGGSIWLSVGPTTGKWKPGQYWAFVYQGETKIAEVQWTVHP